jgi:hypothetical protein
VTERAALDLHLFEEVADAVRSLVPAELGPVRCRAQRYGIKLWFETANPPREHYEAQVLGPSACEEARVLALEVGFHAEHADPARNQAVLDRLLAGERRWRRTLGREAEAGPFLGRREEWRRVSELWADPDLSDPALGLEIGARLTDYACALEPFRRENLVP